MAAGTEHLVDRVGCFRPKIEQLPELGPGEIGFITAQIKEVARDPRRRHHHRRQAPRRRRRCPASRKSSRWCSAACSRSTPPISRSCATASPSCASTTPASASRWRRSAALGFGFRCGFLGLLHLEIIQERLTREYDLDLITTAPSVVYHIAPHAIRRTSRRRRSSSTTRPTCPTPTGSRAIEEPWIEATIYTPDEYLGAILKLCQDRRGIQKDLTYVGGPRAR